MNVTDEEWIAGFWRRIGALFIDAIILGTVGFCLGVFLEEEFVQLGRLGRLIGFGTALSYFGILNSRMFGGQTIGKKILNIRVVNKDNQTISLPRSLARYVILSAPQFLNGTRIPSETLAPFLGYLIQFIVIGGNLSLIYLYIFNRTTRQSLHDLIVGTFVVKAGSEKSTVGPVWRPHFIMVGIFFLLTALLPVFFSGLIEKFPMKKLSAARVALEKEASVIEAPSVTLGTLTSTNDEGTKTTRLLNAKAIVDNESVADAALAEKLATILVLKFPDLQNIDNIQLTLTYGYDIGIWSYWKNQIHTFRPEDLIKVN